MINEIEIKDGKCLTCGAVGDCCCMNWIGKPSHGVGKREKIIVTDSMTWEQYGEVLEKGGK